MKHWRKFQGHFVGHQSESRTIRVEATFQVTHDPDQDEEFVQVVKDELRLQFGSTLLGVGRNN